jgi:DNA-binding MarR family transcriptional regulator
MTQTQSDPTSAIPVGQAIGGALGQAQSVLAGLLVHKVAQAGADRETYLALQRLGVLGDDAARDAYIGDLADWLDLDAGAAAVLADRLVAAGLATAGLATAGPAMGGQETVRTTDEGARLRAEIAGSISAVTAPIYESLTASDVETTVRTLRYLATSVRSLNPAAPAGPAGPGASPEPGDRS